MAEYFCDQFSFVWTEQTFILIVSLNSDQNQRCIVNELNTLGSYPVTFLILLVTLAMLVAKPVPVFVLAPRSMFLPLSMTATMSMFMSMTMFMSMLMFMSMAMFMFMAMAFTTTTFCN